MVPFGKRVDLYYVGCKTCDFVPTFPPGDFLPSRFAKENGDGQLCADSLHSHFESQDVGYIPILGQANLAAFVVIE